MLLPYTESGMPYYIPVLLSDGNSKSIGEIVDNKLKLEVLSFNTNTGCQEKCKIIDWSKIIPREKYLKIKGHNKNNHNIRSFIACSSNQKIFANNNWMLAKNIEKGMIIQFETSAEKTQKYKITTGGKQNLSACLRNNKRGKNNKQGIIIKRGGNGNVNELQKTFFEHLTGEWSLEFIVPTRKNHLTSGYPSHYKIDIACERLKIGIELDGGSHGTIKRRKQDDKKDLLLKELGWTIIRIKNEDLKKDFYYYVDLIDKFFEKQICDDGKNCPVNLLVGAVEDIKIPELYVYNINIDKCHNFYANGVLVHS